MSDELTPEQFIMTVSDYGTASKSKKPFALEMASACEASINATYDAQRARIEELEGESETPEQADLERALSKIAVMLGRNYDDQARGEIIRIREYFAAQQKRIEDLETQELARDAAQDARIEDTDASVIRLCKRINRLRAERDALREAGKEVVDEVEYNGCESTRLLERVKMLKIVLARTGG